MTLMLLGAAAIGISLGMLGSGGSAITVPVLVYIVGHHAKQSIAESMAIVGAISLIAAVPYAIQKQIHWRSVLLFGIPGMFGTFLGAYLGGIVSGAVQLTVFGSVLLVTAYMMLRPDKPVASKDGTSSNAESHHHSPVVFVILEGTIVGAVTGFVGVGGGFLIVPALVAFAKLPMRLSIGTSLVIIALKAVIGYAKYQYQLEAHGLSVDFTTIAIFTAIGITGSLLGKYLNSKMNQAALKKVFAVFLIALGGFVIFSEGRKLPAFNSAQATPVAQATDTCHDTFVRSYYDLRLRRNSDVTQILL